jgi:hypothetical protein
MRLYYESITSACKAYLGGLHRGHQRHWPMRIEILPQRHGGHRGGRLGLMECLRTATIDLWIVAVDHEIHEIHERFLSTGGTSGGSTTCQAQRRFSQICRNNGWLPETLTSRQRAHT